MLDWIDVLNESFEWSGAEDAHLWFEQLISRRADASPGSLLKLMDCLQFIRQQLTRLHFGEEVDVHELDSRVRKLRLAFGTGDDRVLVPLFSSLHALPAANDDSALLDAVSDTLILQFAQYLDVLARGSTSVLCRCEGVYHGQVAPNMVPPDLERRWRSEIELLSDQSTDPTFQRCGDFFLSHGKARFCSESCRFRTFQLKKQLNDPGYLAAKQRRYRAKRKVDG